MQTYQRLGLLAKKIFDVDLPLQVCESPAGFYIGTVHPEDGPFSRESQEYFRTRDGAEQALERGEWSQLEYDI